MKILQVHNYYQQAGGEDAIVENEGSLLESYGHDVVRYFINNDSICSIHKKISTVMNVHYSKQALRQFTDALEMHSPDVVHVHNFFPLLTPSIYDACFNARIAVVQSLHNFRTVCAGSYFMRSGKVCEKCINSSPYQAVRYRCYRKSFIGSWAVARMISYHKRIQTWSSKVDAFIVNTPFSKRKFIECGFPETKIHINPNFLWDTPGVTNQVHKVQRSCGLFVGRLSTEKGVATLLEAWKDIPEKLRIAGTGPMTEDVLNSGLQNVEYLGRLDKNQILFEMDRALFLVVPSTWYEGFPMVIVEAFNRGLAVITSRLGNLAEIISEGKTGLFCEPGNANDLRQKIMWALNNSDKTLKMGQQARLEYEKLYSPHTNYSTLINIYNHAIECKIATHSGFGGL